VFVGIDHLQWDLEQDVVSANPDQSLDQLLGEIDEFEKVAEGAGNEATTSSSDGVATELIPSRENVPAIGIELNEVAVPEPAESMVEAESTDTSNAQNAASTDVECNPSVEFGRRPTEFDDEAPNSGSDRDAGVVDEPETPEDPTWPQHETIEIELPGQMPVDPFDRLWRETVREERREEAVESEQIAKVDLDTTAVDQIAADSVSDQLDQSADSGPPPQLSGKGVSNRSTTNPVPSAKSATSGFTGRTAAVAEEAPARSRLRRWRGVLVGVAVILIAAQVIWYLLPSWILDPEKRWLPEQVCAIAGCKLEPLRDLSQLLLTNVVVRAHPERPEVRQIDLLLVNSGTFDQAFPDIEITFSTPAGDRVAWKRFTPVQYLAGEMKEATAIPRKTPVRISLEVTDPGTLAYAYEITLK